MELEFRFTVVATDCGPAGVHSPLSLSLQGEADSLSIPAHIREWKGEMR